MIPAANQFAIEIQIAEYTNGMAFDILVCNYICRNLPYSRTQINGRTCQHFLHTRQHQRNP